MSSVVPLLPEYVVPGREVIRSAIGLLKKEGILYLDDCWITGKRGGRVDGRPEGPTGSFLGQNKLG
ncbi:hypothetical protein P7H12_12750 [Paenibacillus larvae]|nr:hypothetical protein [Paenibacillus larvae]MDT2264284.1 hypothetical protein [Paenibacillus larvae]